MNTKILPPAYDHVDIERLGRRRLCLICGARTTILIDDEDAAEVKAWQFDRLHRHEERRPN